MDIELSDIAKGIKLELNNKTFVDYPRPYLGMSQIGHSYSAHLWFYFHWAAKTSHAANSRSER